LRGSIPQLNVELDKERSERKFGLPFFQASVPQAQQPTQELLDVRRQRFMEWPTNDKYDSKMTGLYAGIMLGGSLPISYVTYDNLPQEFPQLILAANIGTFAVMLVFIGRLLVSWNYVGQRLKERKTYYEAQERGLFARKDNAALLRDRMLYKTEVKPVLDRIYKSLLTTSLYLLLSLGSGEVLTTVQGEAGPSTLKAVTGSEATRFNTRLKADPDFAAREQARAQRGLQEDGSGVKPVYCDSRYYKILAGGNGQGGVGCAD
jgi:hypothetical protein